MRQRRANSPSQSRGSVTLRLTGCSGDLRLILVFLRESEISLRDRRAFALMIFGRCEGRLLFLEVRLQLTPSRIDVLA